MCRVQAVKIPSSPFAPILLCVLASSPVWAAPLAERHVLPDGAGLRAFVVATDEISASDALRKARPVELPPLANAEAARQAAAVHKARTGEDAEVVLYEEGRARSEFTRRIVTNRLAVKLRPGADAAAFAARHGLADRGPLASSPGWRIFETTGVARALEVFAEAGADAAAAQVAPQLRRKQSKRFVPNDPLFSSQWHLRNTTTPGLDVNVVSVWDTWKGNGVRIGIVDDGLQVTHPDLSPNVDTVNDHDWNDATPNDPSPDVTVDHHGTSCAGVAAGRGNNGLGISGAAPEATLVGLRLIGGSGGTDQDEADASNWSSNIIQLKSNSWGPNDDGVTLEGPGPLMAAALENAVNTGRGGLGTVFLWAAGNGGDVGDNSNYDGYANSRFTIAVAAVANDGTQSYYSEPGANVLITAPSDGGTLGITTTDITGTNGYNNGTLIPDANYTNDFGGTSSACPLAAGVVALVLQSKPTLGWRDVQEILLRSATKIHATDTDWSNNGAGFHFNHKYGAGLINAQAAVALAANWTNLGSEQSVTSAQTGLAVSIPDNNATGVTRTFNLSASNIRVERVTVKVNINHLSRGQLTVTLTSPSGTVSRLAEKHGDTGDNYADWTFSSVRSWGENSAGNWTLNVADRAAGTTGTLTSATLTVFGTQGAPPNLRPVVSAATVSPASNAYFDQTLTVTGVTATDAESDPIAISYAWEESTDGTTFTAIAGASSATLPLTASQSGKLVRCAVSGSDAGGAGAVFATNAVAVNRRPPQTAAHGTPFNYDSDLFIAGGAPSFTRSVIINEFSQGTSGNKEWVELLVLKTADLRGFTLRDRGGTYTTFANAATWAAVPAGTVIVIYNAADRDTVLPADDTEPAGGTMIVPFNNASLFTAGAWGGLSNTSTGNELVEIRDAAAVVVDGVSFNTNTTHLPDLGTVGSATAAAFTGDTETGADLLADWTKPAATAATPGAGNSTANSALISSLRSSAGTSQFRFGAAGDSVPGLSIATATGVISGSPDVNGGGVFQIVIERFSGTTVVSQSFPLFIANAGGAFVVQAGKSIVLDQPLSLAGNLTMLGNLDTAGHSLTVNGTITAQSGITNTTGTISYLHRSGAPIPGNTQLIANPANDLADPDGDGISNLTEFILGLDPSAPSTAGLPLPSLNGSRPTLTYTVPIGALGVTHSVEYSQSLAGWSSGASVEIVSDTTVGNLRTLVIRATTAGPGFLRLKVSR